MVAIAKTNSVDRLCSIAANALSPTTDQDPVDWLSENFALNPEFEAGSGNVDLREMPWWKDPLRELVNPATSEISVMGSTQLGKTVTLISMLVTIWWRDPSPSMVVLPTEPDAKFFRDRVYGDCEVSCADLRDAIPPVRLRNMQSIELRGMRAYLAWSGSSQRLRSKPAKYILQTEIDTYDYSGEHGDPTKTAVRRTDQFYGSTVVRESTPVGDGSKIHEYYQAGDQRKWMVKCPHCGREQILNFYLNRDGRGGIGGIYDEHRNMRSREEVRSSAHYVCLSGCRIDNSFKRMMLLGGRWKATAPEKKAVSYHLWQIFNPKKSFGDLAVEYVKAVEEGTLREFTQDVLGRRYLAKNRLPLWSILADRLSVPDYGRGGAPADAWFVTAGADVQEDRVYWLAAAWSPGRVCSILDWGVWSRYLPTGEMDLDDLRQLPKLLQMSFPVEGGENPLGADRLMARVAGCDVNYRKNDALDVIAEANDPRLLGVRGDHTLKADRRWRITSADRDPETNKPIEGSRIIYGIFTHFYQEQIQERLSSPDDFSIRLPRDVLPGGEPLLKQLVNVKRVDKTWKAISGKIGEDWRDCLVYSSCLADMIVEKTTRNWSVEAFKKWKMERSQIRSQSKTGASSNGSQTEAILER